MSTQRQQSPTFSVVTPALNCGAFLERNLNSLRAQQLPVGAIEHWVIDGGSKDGTVEFLKKQPDVFWISEKDKGLSDAVNKGIQRARGEWIIWLNADDYLAPDACRVLLDNAAKYPDIRVFAGDIAIMGYDGKLEQIVKGWDYHLDRLLGTKTGMNQASTIVHREVYEKVGLLDISIRYAMDYEWLVRAMHAFKCLPIDHTLAYYSRRPGSIMDANMKAHFEEFLRQRRKYHRPRLSRGEFRILFYIYTEPLRRIAGLRKAVRSIKRAFGSEPLHPMS